jgi:hypothetical protein
MGWRRREGEGMMVCLFACLFVPRGMAVPFVGDEQPNVSPTVAARR